MGPIVVFLVVALVVVAAAGVFALAWWSSARSRALGAANREGDGQQDTARLWADAQKTDRGGMSQGGGLGGSS